MEPLPELTDSDRLAWYMLWGGWILAMLLTGRLCIQVMFRNIISFITVAEALDKSAADTVRRLGPLVDKSLQLGRQGRAERLRTYAKRVERKADRWMMVTYWEFSAELDTSIERAKKTHHASLAEKLRSKYGAAGALPYNGELA